MARMENNANHLPDWITAASTALTALLAALGTFLGLRASHKAKMPIVEPSGYVRDDGIIMVTLIIRNRLHETITLDSIRIKSPAYLTFAADEKDSEPWKESRYYLGTERFQKRGSLIDPLGTPAGNLNHGDSARLYAVLSLDGDWPGGDVKLELRLSSKASTIRDKRIVVKTHIPAAKVKNTEDKASSQA